MPDRPGRSLDVGWEEIAAVMDTLRGDYGDGGEPVARFEQLFATWTGVGHAVAVSSGTAALHLALRANGVGRGARVVTSPLASRASTERAIEMAGCEPVYAEVDPHAWTLAAASVEARVKEGAGAIVAVHAFGQVCDMDALASVAERYDVPLLEDCVAAPGGEWNGRRVGSFGTGCFSCDEESTACAGGGGMVTTDSLFVASVVRELRQRANGFDCLMPGLCGVIGAAHIGRMRGYPELRRENMRILREALAGCPGLLLPRPADAATPAGQWLPLGVGQPAVARAVWAAVRDAGYVATCVPLPSGTCLEGHAATGEAGRACGPSGMVVALLIDVLSTSDDLHRLAEAIRERVDVATAPQG